MRKSAKLAKPLHSRPVNAVPPASAASASWKASSTAPAANSSSASFEVVYKNPKMNKAGSFDGTLMVNGSQLKLLDDEGKLLAARVISAKDKLELGATFMLGKWEVECGNPIGDGGGGSGSHPPPAAAVVATATAALPAHVRGSGVTPRPLVMACASAASAAVPTPPGVAAPPPAQRAPPRQFVPSSTAASSFRPPGAKCPASGGDSTGPSCVAAPMDSSVTSSTSSARSSALAAIEDGELMLNRGDTNDKASVVVDRQLARLLRPWQKEGVQFMYDCVSGRKSGASGAALSGCILAHDPGLGKTLSAITMLFTLLRGGPNGAPLVKKAVVVCPASLCKNWAAEIKRWLPQRLKPTLLPEKTAEVAEAVRDFARCPPQKLLILSYDAARIQSAILETAAVGLMICDEGHKLKACGGNQTVDALRRICKTRRVILTGTPLQNDYKEFWALCDFVCPGELGALSSFARDFASPIDAGAQPRASAQELLAAREAQARLRLLTEPFVQRREKSLLSTLLPPRTELALFPRLSRVQSAAYQQVVSDGMPTQSQHVFAALNRLKNICSCADGIGDMDGMIDTERVPQVGATPMADVEVGSLRSRCAKLDLLLRLLPLVHAAGEQVVICSGLRRSLDMIESSLRECGWGALRVDGTTPVAQRQVLVDRFNTKGCPEFVFLLASKAGGVGFNLTSASRLVLFDPDWNPAIDDQAMGRVYRQGQTRPVHIWRLFHAGTVEEKIFQRQLAKKGMHEVIDGTAEARADVGVDSAGGVGGAEGHADRKRQQEASSQKHVRFKRSELRQIFSFDESGACSTLSQLLGRRQRALAAQMSTASAWMGELPDPLLQQALAADSQLRDQLAFACDLATLHGLKVQAKDGEDDEASEDSQSDEERHERVGKGRIEAGNRCGDANKFEDSDEEECFEENEYDFDDGFLVDDNEVENGAGDGDKEEDDDDDEDEAEDEVAAEVVVGDGIGWGCASQLELESDDEVEVKLHKTKRNRKRAVQCMSDDDDE